MAQDLIAVVDIGKTHAKLSVIDAPTGEITWSVQRESRNQPQTPGTSKAFRQLDAGGIERWLLASLSQAPGKKAIRALVPIAHGAAVAVVDRTGQLLALPDYEDDVFDSVRERYGEIRNRFVATYSPALPLGLNLGIQLFYLQSKHPELLARAEALLLYPQYWAWRLSGVMAREVTSLGCHTDLWLPEQGRFSRLAAFQGWAELFPPLHRAGDVLGTVTADVANATGLDPACRVLCGLHDSNASYLCHRLTRRAEEPFAVVSSGTWTVIMAHGGDLARLREDRDMLANVDALGTPVPTARFMGGREYEAIAGTSTATSQPTPENLQSVLSQGAMAFRGGQLVNATALDAAGRSALATLYCALQTDRLLDRLGASSTVIIDGPLAANPLYGALLAAWRPQTRVLRGDPRTGPRECARLLCGYPGVSHLRETAPLLCDGLDDYRAAWGQRVDAAECAA